MLSQSDIWILGVGCGGELVVGHQLRFCPEFVALRDAVDRGELGRLSSFAGWCYGNLLDQGPHLRT